MVRCQRVLVIVCTLVLAGWGTASQWLPLGPSGGSVTSFCADPLSASTVYALTDSAGLFASYDTGWTWEPLGWLGPGVSSVAPSMAAPDTLFATMRGSLPGTGGVLKSTDGGHTWTPARGGLGDPATPPSSPSFRYVTINAVAPHPVDPALLLAASASSGGLYRSASGGSSWTRLAFDNEVFDVLFDPRPPYPAYASVRDPGRSGTRGGVFRSTNGGVTWFPARSGLLRNPGKDEVYASPRHLIMAPSDSLTLYGLSERELVRSTDGGASWTTVSPALPATPDAVLTGVTVAPSNAREIWLTTLQRGLWHSRDGGTTWQSLLSLQCGSDVAGALHTSTLSVLAAHTPEGTLLVGRQDLGVLRSSDQGLTWSESTDGLLATRVHAVALAAAPASSLWAGTSNGAFRSIDRGTTWQRASTGLGSVCDARRREGDPQPPDCNAVRALLAPRGGAVLAQTACAVAATSSEGAAWVPVVPQSFAPTTMVTTPDGRLYALRQNAVWRSVDGGHTWSGCGTGPWGSEPATALVVDPDSPGIVTVLTPGVSWVSCEECSSWTRIVSSRPLECSGSAPLQTNTGLVLSRGHGAPPPPCGPTYTATALVGTSCGLYLSSQIGRVWRRAAADGLSVEALLADPDSPEEVWAAARGAGVLHSTDGGSTWSAFNDGLPTLECTSLALDAARRTLYVGTDGFGVLGRSLPQTARVRLVAR